MTTLDELVVKIKADAGQFEREMNRATSAATNATSRMGAGFGMLKGQILSLVPALSSVALVAFAKNAFSAADALNDLSSRTGVSAEYLSAMKTEIENSGGSIEQFAQALFFMNRQIGEGIKDAAGPAATALRELGLNINTLTSNSPEENFRIIADAISKLPTQFQRAEAGAALLGRGVAGIQAIIEKGAAGIDEITAKAKDMGLALSQERLDAIDSFGDRINTLGNRARSVAAGALADLVIMFDKVIDRTTNQNDVLQEMLNKAKSNYEIAQKLGHTEIAKQAKGEVDYLSGRIMQKEAEESARQHAATTAKTIAAQKEAAAAKKKLEEEAAQQRKQAAKEVKEVTSETKKLDVAFEEVGRQGEISARIIKDSFADALESVLFDFKNLGSAGASILDGLARNIARQNIINPLSNSIQGELFGNGLPWDKGILGNAWDSIKNSLPSFDVGSYRVPRDMMANIHEDEMIIPAAQARQIRSGGGIGGGVTFTQVINVSPGVPELIRSEINRAAPGIASAAQNGVFMAMEKGGRASQIVGKRS